MKTTNHIVSKSYGEYPDVIVRLFPAFEIAVRDIYLSSYTQKTKDKRIDAARREAFENAQDRLEQLILEIIGEDEDAIGSLQHPNDRRNQLRAEQRSRLQALLKGGTE